MCKLSIIIPTFNSEKLIKKLLDDLKKLKHVEIVFVDDGSVDSTVNIIEENKTTEFDFQLFKCKHMGVSHARNVGLMHSKSERVMFIDADDRINHQILQEIIDNDVKSADITSFTKNCKAKYQVSNKHLLVVELLVGKQDRIIAAPFSKVYNREFLLKNNIFFSKKIVVGEDMIFNLRAVLASNDVLISEKSFYLYRQNVNSVTKSVNYDIEENSINFVNELSNVLKGFPEYHELLKRVIINSWIGDSVRICKYQFDRKKVMNLKKETLRKYTFKEILFLNFSFKKNILKILLLLNAYKTISLMVNLKKNTISRDIFLEI